MTGLTHVMATVRSMAEPERSWTGQFRVDASSVDCALHPRHFRASLDHEKIQAYSSQDSDFDLVDVTADKCEELRASTVIEKDSDKEIL